MRQIDIWKSRKKIARMKRRIKEETIIFKDIIKWFFLATIVGFFIGLAITFFLKFLESFSIKTNSMKNYYLFLPLAMMDSGILIKYFAPQAEGHGTEKVIEAVHKQAGKIPLAVVPVKLLATILTLGFGGSAGKEGPCAQIGAAISSFLAGVFKFSDHDRRKFVICGISAAFATVFGTPFAGAIFGVEVLYMGIFYTMFYCHRLLPGLPLIRWRYITA
jgi:H+/Cl- antiporter ClcA